MQLVKYILLFYLYFQLNKFIYYYVLLLLLCFLQILLRLSNIRR